ncbi:MAG: ABC transporter permease [Bacteroidales bacterium]|nr:ABC transporter permease [Bacteroidales bacterium]MCF8402938.1 ABC transporter permease [Bacteroidales bacterium]
MRDLKLAWRNLWRNSRRSLITLASIFFGVILSALMTSIQYGSYDSMINNVVKFYSGYAQVFSEAYDENKTINNTFELSDSLEETILNCKEITRTTPRLEYFALASSENKTKGAIIIGIDTEKEDQVTEISKWVNSGEYLSGDDKGVLLSINLANYLRLQIGDTLVLYGQGYHGVTAAGLYPVKGILKFPSPELNNQMIYMNIQTAQELFGAENLATSMIVMVEDHTDLSEAMVYLHKNIQSPLMVKSWDELQPELVQMIEGDRAGGIVMKLVLYMVVGFGIFGTIIMMLAERSRELGVTIAVGMQKRQLAWIVFLETILTGFIGALAGIIGSIPVISYFISNPVKLSGDAAQTMIKMGMEPYMYFSRDLHVFYTQGLIVFFLSVIIGFYTIYKVYRVRVNQALRA